jgi:hypothetical protein
MLRRGARRASGEHQGDETQTKTEIDEAGRAEK